MPYFHADYWLRTASFADGTKEQLNRFFAAAAAKYESGKRALQALNYAINFDPVLGLDKYTSHVTWLANFLRSINEYYELDI